MLKVGHYYEYKNKDILVIDKVDSSRVNYTWIDSKRQDVAGFAESSRQLINGELIDVTKLYTSPMGKVLLGDRND